MWSDTSCSDLAEGTRSEGRWRVDRASAPAGFFQIRSGVPTYIHRAVARQVADMTICPQSVIETEPKERATGGRPLFLFHTSQWYHIDMIRRIAIGFAFMLLAAPALALADTVATSVTVENPLVGLYTQLISLLQQEIALLENPQTASNSNTSTSTSLSIYPTTGVAPLFATFVVNDPTGTESINFGNGGTTGTQGCTKNALGWCDLTAPVPHEYQIPGNYTVTLYRHLSSTTIEVLSTSTVEALLPSATLYDPNQ